MYLPFSPIRSGGDHPLYTVCFPLSDTESAALPVFLHLWYTVDMLTEFSIGPAYHGCTAETYLRRELGLSRRQIASLKFRPGGLLLNGKRCRTTAVLREGDLLSVCLKSGGVTDLEIRGTGPLPEILYEDEQVLVVDKPSGLVFHPSPGHYTDSLANQMAAYAASKGNRWSLRPVGRLDKDTSGAAVFAKSAEAAALLNRPGVVDKTYFALVEGIPDPPVGCIDLPIAVDPHSLGKMCVSEAGKPAQTYYRTVKTFEHHALLSVRIVHGRTHQIRLHLAQAGHPLAGDPLYGNGEKDRTHAMLHCRSAEILLPFSKETICVSAPFPKDWEPWIR